MTASPNDVCLWQNDLEYKFKKSNQTREKSCEFALFYYFIFSFTVLQDAINIILKEAHLEERHLKV